MAGRTGTAALAWQRGSQERLVPGPPRMRNVRWFYPETLPKPKLQHERGREMRLWACGQPLAVAAPPGGAATVMAHQEPGSFWEQQGGKAGEGLHVPAARRASRARD